MIPTVAVVPVRNHIELTKPLLSSLIGQVQAIYVADNGSTDATPEWLQTWAPRQPITVVTADMPDADIHQMWNAGRGWAYERVAGVDHNVAFLNNDIVLPSRGIPELAWGLRSRDDLLAVHPREHAEPGIDPRPVRVHTSEGLIGWCFVVRGESCPYFDEGFQWWFGENDLDLTIRDVGKAVGYCQWVRVAHLGSRTISDRWAEIKDQIAADGRRFHDKWAVKA